MPVPADDQVLVRVVAGSVNAIDWHSLRGAPVLVRLTDGPRRPKSRIRGVDVAGRVEAVGRDVTWAKPGDEVFGARDGAFAEFVAGRIFAPKPANLSFDRPRPSRSPGSRRCRPCATMAVSSRGSACS